MSGIVTAAVIAGGAGIYASKQAGKAANKRTSVEKMMEQLLYDGAISQQQYGQFLTELSRDPLISSRNFLNAAANGDQETLMQLMGPEMKNVSDGARQSLQTMAQLMPRSGASAEFLANIPFQSQIQQGNIMSQARPNAINQLMGFGTNLANLGGNFTSGASNNATNLLGIGSQRRNDAFSQGAAAGEGAYNTVSGILGPIMDYYSNKRKGTNAGSVPNATSFYGGSSDGNKWNGD